MSLSIVPDPAEQSAADALGSQIEKLSALVDRAIDGDDIEHTDALAKLVGALAKLIEAKNKAEASVKPAQLMALMAGMSEVVNAHVAAPEVKADIQRGWRRLHEGMSG